MTRPYLLWFLLSRTLRRLAKWLSVAFLVGVLAAILGGGLVLVVIVAYAGYLSYRSLPAPEPVVSVMDSDRYRDHVGRVMASLSEPSPASGELAERSSLPVNSVVIRDLSAETPTESFT